MSKNLPHLCLATTNSDKIQEFQSILKRSAEIQDNIQILSLNSFNRNLPPPEETGKTFFENANIKAQYYFREIKIPVLSEDSGLCVNSLDNQPGIFSKRWAKNGQNYEVARQRIKDALLAKGKSVDRVSAFFHCSLVYFDGKILKEFSGKTSGVLDLSSKLDCGFGYDPIFIPLGFNKTFHNMSKEKKNKISHRYAAISKFVEFMSAV